MMHKSFQNAACGAFAQVVCVCTQFVMRTVFIRELGAAFAGLDALMAHIVHVLVRRGNGPWHSRCIQALCASGTRGRPGGGADDGAASKRIPYGGLCDPRGRPVRMAVCAPDDGGCGVFPRQVPRRVCALCAGRSGPVFLFLQACASLCGSARFSCRAGGYRLSADHLRCVHGDSRADGRLSLFPVCAACAVVGRACFRFLSGRPALSLFGPAFWCRRQRYSAGR